MNRFQIIQAAWANAAQRAERTDFHVTFENATGLTKGEVERHFADWNQLPHQTTVDIAVKYGTEVHVAGFQAYLAEVAGITPPMVNGRSLHQLAEDANEALAFIADNGRASNALADQEVVKVCLPESTLHEVPYLSIDGGSFLLVPTESKVVGTLRSGPVTVTLWEVHVTTGGANGSDPFADVDVEIHNTRRGTFGEAVRYVASRWAENRAGNILEALGMARDFARRD